MNELDDQQVQAIAGGLLDFFMLTLVGPRERLPSRGDWASDGN